MSKNQKIMLGTFSITCVVAIFACLIVNFAIDRAITWALYPLLSVPFGWLLLAPMTAKKHGVLLSLCSMTVIAVPYLFLLEKITPMHGWFAPIGIPSAIIGAGAIWLLFLLFRFVKINSWYKSAITVFIIGVLANPAISYFVDMYLESKVQILQTVLETAACLIVTVALFVIGARRNKAKHAVPETNQTIGQTTEQTTEQTTQMP